MITDEPFCHRRNNDETIDSYCTRCFVTVGTALDESELAEIEQSHLCDPDGLLRWRQLLRQSSAIA